MREAFLACVACLVGVCAVACGSSNKGNAGPGATSTGGSHGSSGSSGPTSSSGGGAGGAPVVASSSSGGVGGASSSSGGTGGTSSDSSSSAASTAAATGATAASAASSSGAASSSSGCTTMSVDAGAPTGVVAGMVPGPGTFVSGCAIFPADNAWNVDVSSTTIATTTKYTGIPQGTHLHPDLGGWTGTAYGIPYNVVPSSQPNAAITFNTYASESDPGPAGWTTPPKGSSTGVTAYPIPNDPRIEGDPSKGQIAGDDHLLVLQQGSGCSASCTLWETWQTTGGTTAPWTAANGAAWDLGSNALRPLGWTSADAAGLSVFAGLLKIAEVKAGVVTHAMRVTFNTTQAGYVYPATHFAGSSALGGSDPPMGLHLRLKASFATTGFSGPGKIVAQAMKTYGLIIADIGSDWFFQGDSDDAWNDQDPNGNDTYVGELLTDFAKVTGADFEVLDTGAPQNTGE